MGAFTLAFLLFLAPAHNAGILPYCAFDYTTTIVRFDDGPAWSVWRGFFFVAGVFLAGVLCALLGVLLYFSFWVRPLFVFLRILK